MFTKNHVAAIARFILRMRARGTVADDDSVGDRRVLIQVLSIAPIRTKQTSDVMVMIENRCLQLSLSVFTALLFMIASVSVVSGQTEGEWFISESELSDIQR